MVYITNAKEEVMTTAEEDILSDFSEDVGGMQTAEENLLSDDEDKDAIQTLDVQDKLFVTHASYKTPQGDPMYSALSALRKLDSMTVRTTVDDEDSPDMDRFLCSNLLDYYNAQHRIIEKPP
jgi:hypothetical protein